MGTQIAPATPLLVIESESAPRERSRVREGLVAGLIGAAAIAIFFLVVDVYRGRPFATPTILGTALLKGPAAVARPEMIAVSIPMVAFFTIVHFLVFAAVGVVASSLIKLGERYPDGSYGAFVLIVMSLYGFQAGCYVLAEQVVGALGAWEFFAANLLAVLGMAGYFWSRHPRFEVVS